MSSALRSLTLIKLISFEKDPCDQICQERRKGGRRDEEEAFETRERGRRRWEKVSKRECRNGHACDCVFGRVCACVRAPASSLAFHVEMASSYEVTGFGAKLSEPAD